MPSGQDVTLYDVILEESTATARFRFLLPALGEGLSYAEVEADFAQLCAGYALPALIENDWEAQAVIITLSDRETEFGRANSEAVQFFEAFRIADGQCEWERF